MAGRDGGSSTQLARGLIAEMASKVPESPPLVLASTLPHWDTLTSRERHVSSGLYVPDAPLPRPSKHSASAQVLRRAWVAAVVYLWARACTQEQTARILGLGVTQIRTMMREGYKDMVAYAGDMPMEAKRYQLSLALQTTTNVAMSKLLDDEISEGVRVKWAGVLASLIKQDATLWGVATRTVTHEHKVEGSVGVDVAHSLGLDEGTLSAIAAQASARLSRQMRAQAGLPELDVDADVIEVESRRIDEGGDEGS